MNRSPLRICGTLAYPPPKQQARETVIKDTGCIYKGQRIGPCLECPLPRRVHRARCQLCGSVKTIPARAGSTKPVAGPVPSQTGNQAQSQPKGQPEALQGNIENTLNCSNERYTASDKVSQFVPIDHIAESQNMVTESQVIQHESQVIQQMEDNNMSNETKQKTGNGGVYATNRNAYYQEHKQEILADIKAIGKKQTRVKWGIPESTYRGWTHKWPELIELPTDTVSFSVDITVSTLEAIAAELEIQARKYRETAESLTASRGGIDG